ncbi:hypothetical protein HQ544_03090 [Candidatus Falkowbacteria bacterium]|nr:hypothetical protein [Candidatus Falkowbacteria bacterium]
MTKFGLKNLIIILMLAVLVVGVLGCTNTLPDDDEQEPVNQEPTNIENPITKTTCAENEQTIFLKDGEIDTSDWFTFRSEKYGFELTYPSVWAYDNTESDNLTRIYGNTDYIHFNTISGIRISETGDNLNELDIQEWFAEKDYYRPREEKVICLGGVKAITNDYGFDLVEYRAGTVFMIHFSFSGKIFDIYFSDGERDDEVTRREYKEFLKMLETFKFDKE